VFVVHARNAVLKGLSPKENRVVPPLRYDAVRRLKRDFPALTIVLNGGLARWDAIERELPHVDGVMLGRAAYHDPYLLAQVDWKLYGDEAPARSRADILRALIPYVEAKLRDGVALRSIACHVLGLYHGRSGGRRFRQILSDASKLRTAGPELFLEALAVVEPVTSGAVDDR
jgi:tRNA-dihydrouridine synthase A